MKHQTITAILRSAGLTATTTERVTDGNTRYTRIVPGYRVVTFGAMVGIECANYGAECPAKVAEITALLAQHGISARETVVGSGMLKIA